MVDIRSLLFYVGLGCIVVISVATSLIAAAPMLERPASASGADIVYLTIATNPVNGLDQYFPANFSVQSGVPVTIVVTNYDTGTNYVAGTPANTSHTFTIPSLHVQIAIPAALGDNQPSVTTFHLTLAAGQYDWLCEAPCDVDAMGTPGYMAGTITAI